MIALIYSNSILNEEEEKKIYYYFFPIIFHSFIHVFFFSCFRKRMINAAISMFFGNKGSAPTKDPTTGQVLPPFTNYFKVGESMVKK